MKVHFSKTCFTPQQHITLLKDRGLSISDEPKAVSYLTNIGYFRLSAYFYPLLEFPKEQHRYKPDATFKKVMDMYRFDRKLNPEKPDVPLNKNDAFQKVQKRRVQEKR